MIYQKAMKRIAQYLTFLDTKRYVVIGEPSGPAADPIACREQEHSGALLLGPWQAHVQEGSDHRMPDEDAVWTPAPIPYRYGSDDQSWWFRTTLQVTSPVPPEYGSTPELFLELDTETDTLIYLNGQAVGAVNPFHRTFRITEYLSGESEVLEIMLELWSGHQFPGYSPFDGPRVLTTVALRKSSYPLCLSTARVLIKVPELYDLYYDLTILYQLCSTLDEHSLLYERIASVVHRQLMGISMTASLETLRRQARQVRGPIQELLSLRNGTLAPQIYSIGNAHLDHAWLWPIVETGRKAARTCANMAGYTEEFPEFRFLFSQPAQMVKLKEAYPAIFERVHAAFRRGQWEPNGCSWIEPDCTLISGESLIRQFSYGRAAVRELFDGYTGDVFWVPDTFGFPASVPQILKGCGIKYFVTSKLSWNDTNRFPYDIFRWEGIDGTGIAAHMITTAYEGTNTPAEVLDAWDHVQHKDVQHALVRSIGEGDGGGGTMRSDLELMRRMGDLQGLPRNRWESLSTALDHVFAISPAVLPVYHGELYLELHRGTLTSQAEIKRYNRRLESALHRMEFLEAMLALRGVSSGVVAEGTLGSLLESIAALRDRAWKIVLTNQFHDILPGSSVRSVNEEAIESYHRAEAALQQAWELAEAAAGADDRSAVCYWNSRSLPVSSLVPSEEGTAGAQLFHAPDQQICPVTLATSGPLACTASDGTDPAPSGGFTLTGDTITGRWHTVTFDGTGAISSCILRASGIELVCPGRALNTLTLSDDVPCNWDAWDIEEDYELGSVRHPVLTSREILSEGELFIQIRQTFEVGIRSHLQQDVMLYAHTPRIDFITKVDWQEDHTILRVQFPTVIKSDTGLFDIPFGYIRRNAHENDRLDRARFEVSAHQWAAVEDAQLTAALLSNSSYGYRIKDGTLSLSLLRAPTAPDPIADRGLHTFTYSFYPRERGIARVMQEALAVNEPLAPLKGPLAPLFASPVLRILNSSCETGEVSVVLEGCKRADAEQGSAQGAARPIVLRLRETLGVSARCTIVLAAELRGRDVYETTLLEDPEGQLVQGAEGERGAGDACEQLVMTFRPFEVKTLLIT